MKLRFEFQPADFWIGAYVRTSWHGQRVRTCDLDVWICLVPMLPLHITVYAVNRRLQRWLRVTA